MKRSLLMLAVFTIAGLISACSEPPVKSGNSSEVQRAHAAKGQGELSSEVKK